jgi:putative membrane protein
MPALDLAVLLGWAQEAVSPVAIGAALLAVSYMILFLRARHRDRALAPGRRGPGVGRGAVFILGCALIVMVTATGVQTYSRELLSAFMFQQLTLLMIVPPLLILGRPGTVLLRGLPRHGAGLVVLRVAVGALRSSLARSVVNPVAVFPLLLVPLFGLYLTGAIDALLATEAGRATLQVGFVAVGVMVMVPLVSTDPLPRQTSYVVRVFDSFLEMQIHAAFGLTLIFSSAPLVASLSTPPPSLGIDALRDQQLAGALVWTYGELPVVVILLISLARWQRQDTRKAARAARRADIEGDAELEDYNAYLRGLGRDGERG